MTVRLFVAIELSEQARTALGRVQAQLGRGCDGVRWTRREQLHLTVCFLGDVPDADVEAVGEAVDRGAAPASPFAMHMTRAACFPDRGPARVVWVDIEQETGALLRLAKGVVAELERLRYSKDRRPFSPHITIGRVHKCGSSERIRMAAEAVSFPLIEELVASVALISSNLSPRGPTYATISRAKLGRDGP